MTHKVGYVEKDVDHPGLGEALAVDPVQPRLVVEEAQLQDSVGVSSTGLLVHRARHGERRRERKESAPG